MMYESGFFENRRGKRLFFAIEGDASSPAWVFCGPPLEEKIAAHGVMRTFARRLVAEGYRVMRFDAEGEGDSEGEVSGLGLEEWAHDAVDAAELLRRRGSDRISLFGCRLGAAVAALAARDSRAERLLLWCPVRDGAAHLQELLRFNLTSQLATLKRVAADRDELKRRLEGGGTVNVLGWEIGRPFYRSVSRMNLAELLLKAGARSDIVSLVRPGTASVGSPGRVVEGLPFWSESRLIDFEQAALAEKSLEILREAMPR